MFYSEGRQFLKDKPNFGFLSDSSPDRWGRSLIDRKERRCVKKEGRNVRKLGEIDYLLSISDITRMGGLRFKETDDEEFLSEDVSIPPFVSLRKLESAVESIENDNQGLSLDGLEDLFSSGSSLGGARPKANVTDENGELWIAKFPSKYDNYDIGAFEKTAQTLASLCGLKTTETKVEKLSKNGSIFLIKRFDRKKEKRIESLSAMTLLGKRDGEKASYLDIASIIKSYSIHPEDDLLELWKRIVFSISVSNTDDHLLNHAFLLDKNGLSLSPLFDVNPVSYGRYLSLNINETDSSMDYDLALSVSPFFNIKKKKQKKK